MDYLFVLNRSINRNTYDNEDLLLLDITLLSRGYLCPGSSHMSLS